jgi:hydantoinase/carbamoylase family amidase
MGSIFATRPGKNNSLPPIGLGSHLDTQPKGGRYDGILGVNCALEVLRTIHENNHETYAPLSIVNWTNEEGARFPPAMIASGVWGGAFELDYAHSRVDSNGISIKSELQRIGFLGDTPCGYTENPLSAHLECHIEQGPILDDSQIPVAAVLGVQSIRWYSIKLRGREQHTGTTPMRSRKDTLLTAARIIVATNEIAMKSTSDGLASIAVINSRPQSINTLSGEVDLNLDLRHPSDEGLQSLENECRQAFERICMDSGVTMDFDTIWVSPALKFDPVAVGFVKQAVKEAGYQTALISGAGHDRFPPIKLNYPAQV